MRVRTLVFALAFGTAGLALAQSGGYVRFPAASPDACAMACASDQLCASWSFGNAGRSYGQNQNSGTNLCTFSSSSRPNSSPGFVSGLPRRDSSQQSVPMVASPRVQNAPSTYRTPTPSAQMASQRPQQNASQGGSTGWEVRPAPWLRGTQASQPTQDVMPPPAQSVPPLPSPTPYQAPRIEYAPSHGAPRVLTPPPQQPVFQPPSQPVPQYRPAPQANLPQYVPPAASAPVMIAPPRRPQPSPPPVAQAAPDLGTPVVPERPRAARGTPRPKAMPAPAAPTARAPVPVEPPAEAAASLAAPPRQDVAARPAPGRGAPRPPVRDPNDIESFRGPDGMIDAAEMRRAQLEAARSGGTPAYSVQREWEAVAAEQQRAEAAGEVRADPLAGTVPVPPPPETRAQRRAREAEEAAEAAAAAADEAQSDETPVEAAPAQRSRPRAARGTPRPRSSSGASTATQPRQALDREPRLSGGPAS